MAEAPKKTKLGDVVTRGQAQQPADEPVRSATVHIGESTWRRAKSQAANLNLTVSSVVAELLERWLAEQDPEAQREFAQAAEARIRTRTR